MSMRPIGYYVHHRGAGHWARARVLAPLLDRPCTLIGTFDARDRQAPNEHRLDLPDDAIGVREGDDGEQTRPEALHYAPIGVPAIRRRMARIAAWVDAHDPVMMIVDVSVEIALFARLLSVPTVVVRLAGDRTDRAHCQAFRAAERLLAPYPATLDGHVVPSWIVEKTLYAGFLSAPLAPVGPTPTVERQIVVMFGRGGRGGDAGALAAAARAVPDYTWHVLGPVHGSPTERPPNLHMHGWVGDPGRWLAGASLVIGSGGDGVIADVAARGKRFICIPEDRPFDEQRVKAEALGRLGAAVVQMAWHGSVDWPALVRSGLALDPARIAGLAEPNALARTVRTLDELATSLDRRTGGHPPAAD